MSGLVITFLWLAAYGVGFAWSSIFLARRFVESHKRNWPSLWRDAEDKSRYRSESTMFALFASLFWPLVTPFYGLTELITRKAFAEDLAAEAELERAQMYAEARRIVRASELEAERYARRDFDRRLGR